MFVPFSLSSNESTFFFSYYFHDYVWNCIKAQRIYVFLSSCFKFHYSNLQGTANPENVRFMYVLQNMDVDILYLEPLSCVFYILNCVQDVETRLSLAASYRALSCTKTLSHLHTVAHSSVI